MESDRLILEGISFHLDEHYEVRWTAPCCSRLVCVGGTSIYFVTRYDMQKAKNLAHQPWIVVHAGDGDDVIILEGPVEIVTDQQERQRINTAYGDKYVAPRTGARATIFEEHTDLYSVHVKHVMTWEYRIVATRTDWRW